jgi:hypothetical protein
MDNILCSTHQELAHIWAQQNRPGGRAAHMFFRGPSIYSYGKDLTHKIARFMGKDVVFVTSDNYSVSTERHKRIVLAAILNKTVFTVPSFTDHADNLEYYLDLIATTYLKAWRARVHAPQRLLAVENTIRAAQQYVACFPEAINEPKSPYLCGKWNRLRAGTLIDLPALRAYVAACAKRTAAAIENNAIEEEKRRAEEEKRRAEEAAALEAWLNGEEVEGWYRFRSPHSPIALRIKGAEVQTTQGKSVPVQEARALYQAIKAGEAIVGKRIGGFLVSGEEFVTGHRVLVVGCYRIPMAEVERIAPELLAWTPSASEEPIS